jgi:dipeptidyl aminopeptidase/acylaminoacyl peptidase
MKITPQENRTFRYWRNLALFSVMVICLAACMTAILLARMQAMRLVHPTKLPIIETPKDYGIEQWEEVSFQTLDGLTIRGWFIPPSKDSSGATIIYVHGLSGNRAQLLLEAAMLYRHGYGALLIDLRNHGESDGDITTMGYLEKHDIEGAVGYLLTRPEVNGNLIGLDGHSLGGSTVIQAAAALPEVRAAIIQSTFTSLDDVISTQLKALIGLPSFPFAPLVIWFGEKETGIKISSVRPVDDIADISPRAVLIIHGEKDDAFPKEYAIALYQAAGEPKELFLIPNAGHGFLPQNAPEEFEARIVSFLDKYLQNR